MVLVKGLLLYLFFVLANAQILQFENSFKVYARDLGNLVEFRFDTISSLGWGAFGFGSSMASAEIYMFWTSGKNVVVSRRIANGESVPQFDDQSVFSLNNTQTFVNPNGTFVCTFTRSKPSNGLKVMDLSSGNVDIIAAFSNVPPKTNSTQTEKLDRHAPSDGSYIGTISLFSNTTVNAGSDNSVQNNVVTHGALMYVAWFMFSPAAIFISRYMKASLGVWWFRFHVLLMIGTGLLSVLAWIFVKFWTTDSAPSTIRSAHVVIGDMILLGMVCQIVLGFVIDRLYSSSRTSIPWWDKMHWYFGRLITLGAWVQVPIGLVYFSTLFALDNGIYIALAIYGFVLVLIFGFKEWRELNFFKSRQGQSPVHVHSPGLTSFE